MLDFHSFPSREREKPIFWSFHQQTVLVGGLLAVVSETSKMSVTRCETKMSSIQALIQELPCIKNASFLNLSIRNSPV